MRKLSDKEDELLLELTEQGASTGQLITRADAHKNLKWHYEIILCLIYKDKVLLQKRNKHKLLAPGKYAFLAGHVTEKDTTTITAVRECYEEYGIEIDERNLINLCTVQTYWPQNYHYAVCFAYKLDKKPKKLILQKEEVSKAKWVKYSTVKKYFLTQNPKTLFYDCNLFRTLFAKLDTIIK